MSTLRRARADLPMQPALCCMDRRDFSALRFARFLMLIISAFLVVGTAAAGAEPYTLGPQDKLRLRVFEWRAPVDQVYEWTALNGDFVVSSSGTVSLPLLGEISAAGLSPNEFAEAISKQMADEMKLRWPPKVAVEVAEYRPFFIVGAVAKPGAYPYQPGLTILRALSIGGGLPRLGEAGLMRHGREVIAGRGSVTQLALKTNELQARKARLEAELKRAEMITFPEELEKARSNPDFARVLEQEESVFKARRTAVDTQVSTLNQLKTYLVSEIDALAQQVELKKGEHATVKQELGNVTTLVEKGLSVSGRQFSLERLSAQLSSDQLQLETALLKAKQEISRTEVAIDETINNRAIEVASLLRATEAELEDTLVRYKTEEKLLYDSEIVFPRLMTSRRQDSARNEPKYSIVRVIDGASQEIAAEETTDVLPGDTIKIELPMLDDLSSILTPPPQATQ
jgi:polysaccharide export outer membrane protein/exopolysaccharide production protein ExoF